MECPASRAILTLHQDRMFPHSFLYDLQRSHPTGQWGAVLLLAVGAFVSLKTLINAGGFAYRHFLRSGKDLSKYGGWAVVTGGTDGIGLAYVHALAKQGLNILIISRSEDKLRDACTTVASKHSVEASYVVADLCEVTDDAWAAISTAISKIDVGVLINNAGMSYDYPDTLDAVDAARVEKQIAINCNTLTKMCKVVLPGMKDKRKGAIVNISSGASFAVPCNPMLSVYAATKAYVDKLSVSLNKEYQEFGISVQVQPPMYVTTKLAKIRRASLLIPTPATYVASAIKCVGYNDVEVPYAPHAVFTALLQSLPRMFLSGYVLAEMKGIRTRALKKREKAQ